MDEKIIDLIDVGRFGIWIRSGTDSSYLCGNVLLPFPSGWDGMSPIVVSTSYDVEIYFRLEVKPKEKDVSLVDLETRDSDWNREKAAEFLKESFQRYMEDVFVPKFSSELQGIGQGPSKVEVHVQEVSLLYRPGGEWLVKIMIWLKWESPIDPQKLYQMALDPWTKIEFPFTRQSDDFVEKVFEKEFPWDVFESERFTTKFFTLWFPIYRHGTVTVIPERFHISDSLFVQKKDIFIRDPESYSSEDFWRSLEFEVEINKEMVEELLQKTDRPKELISDVKVIVGLLGARIKKGFGDVYDIIRGLDYFLDYGGVA